MCSSNAWAESSPDWSCRQPIFRHGIRYVTYPKKRCSPESHAFGTEKVRQTQTKLQFSLFSKERGASKGEGGLALKTDTRFTQTRITMLRPNRNLTSILDDRQAIRAFSRGDGSSKANQMAIFTLVF